MRRRAARLVRHRGTRAVAAVWPGGLSRSTLLRKIRRNRPATRWFNAISEGGTRLFEARYLVAGAPVTPFSVFPRDSTAQAARWLVARFFCGADVRPAIFGEDWAMLCAFRRAPRALHREAARSWVIGRTAFTLRRVQVRKFQWFRRRFGENA
jgi:hypothetical protein